MSSENFDDCVSCINISMILGGFQVKIPSQYQPIWQKNGDQKNILSQDPVDIVYGDQVDILPRIVCRLG